MKYLLPMIPTLVTFGPVFMVMGARSGGLAWIAYAGGLLLSIGLSALFVIVARQAHELRALKEALGESGLRSPEQPTSTRG